MAGYFRSTYSFDKGLFIATIVGLLINLTECKSCDVVTLANGYECITKYAAAGVNFNHECSVADFNDCLDAVDSRFCSGLTELSETVSAYLESSACTDGVAGSLDQTCENMVLTCEIESNRRTLDVIGNKRHLSEISCICDKFEEDFSTFTRHRFEKCIASLSGTCLENSNGIANQMVEKYKDTLIKGQFCTKQLGLLNNCACAAHICAATYLGNDFMERITTNRHIASYYPDCLELGTEAQFRSAVDCLFSFPESCGFRNFTPNVPEGSDLPYVYDILTLRYSCVAECDSSNILPNWRSLSDCLSVMGGYASYSADEIKALIGQTKHDYCSKADLAMNCVAKRLEACPYILFNLTLFYETGVETDLGISFQLFNTCSINLLEYTDLLSGPKGAATIWKLELLLVTLIAGVVGHTLIDCLVPLLNLYSI